MVEVAALGREPEREVCEDVAEAGEGEVEPDTADVLQPHLLWVLILEHVPVSEEL